MNVEFKFIDDNLHIIGEEFETKLEPMGKGPNIVYSWEQGATDSAILDKISHITAVQYPDNLHVHSYYATPFCGLLYFVMLDKKQDDLIGEALIRVEYIEWQSPYNVELFFERLEQRFTEIGINCHLIYDSQDIELSVEFQIVDGSIAIAIDEIAKKIQLEYDLMDCKFIKDISTNLMVKLFGFPKQYEVICSQYLLWFGELLQSLGIDANVSTENKNGQTFLSIEPKDNTVLTSEIEKTLYLYLALPYSEYLPAATVTENHVTKMQFQQLHNQVQMLNQQVEFKTSMLELEELKRKEQSSELVEVKGKLLLLESLQDSKLELFDGAVTLESYKLGPMVINPKRTIEWFGKSRKPKDST